MSKTLTKTLTIIIKVASVLLFLGAIYFYATFDRGSEADYSMSPVDPMSPESLGPLHKVQCIVDGQDTTFLIPIPEEASGDGLDYYTQGFCTYIALTFAEDL